MDNRETYEALYEQYEDSRLLLKLKEYALWTIPSVFPNNDKDYEAKGNIPVEHDFQSIGSALVNYLASKLTSLLFPVAQSFFRIQPTDQLLTVAANVLGRNADEVGSTLIDLENKACSNLFSNASYAQLTQMLRHLIITGNCMFKRVDGKLTVYGLRNFSQLRDNEGNLLDAILREDWAYGSLPDEVVGLVNQGHKKDTDCVTVYTRIKRERMHGNPVYVVSQEVEGHRIGQPSMYPLHLCPYQIVVWNLINGDSNGRGMIEDYAGDFAKVSDLSRALAIYEINVCKVVNLVKAGSTVDIDALNEAECGEYIQGDPAQIGVHEGGDANKIEQLLGDIQVIYQRLSVAFMYQGNTRDAERVTAEEIRLNAQEAEQTLGGVYSQLSQGIHVPLSHILCYEVAPELLTALITGNVKLEVITGLPALGRSTVVTQLLQATQELAVIIPTLAQISARFDKERIVDLVLQSRGINLSDIMLSEEELAQQQQAQAAQAAAVDPLQQVQATQGLL